MRWHKWGVLIVDRPALHYVLLALPTSHHAGCPARSRLPTTSLRQPGIPGSRIYREALGKADEGGSEVVEERPRRCAAVKDRLDMRDLAVRDLVPLGDHYDALSRRLCLQLKENSGLMASPDNGLHVQSHRDLKKPGEGCDVVVGAAMRLEQANENHVVMQIGPRLG